MLVDYIVPGGSWSSVTALFDNSAGDANEKFAPAFHDQVYALGGYGAASNTKLPMANTQVSVPFRWNAVYASYAAALASVLTLRAALKGLRVHLRVTEGATVHYYPNAVLESYSPDVHGRTVDHAVVFATDDVTGTPPS
jgi:hypothetical protein